MACQTSIHLSFASLMTMHQSVNPLPACSIPPGLKSESFSEPEAFLAYLVTAFRTARDLGYLDG